MYWALTTRRFLIFIRTARETEVGIRSQLLALMTKIAFAEVVAAAIQTHHRVDGAALTIEAVKEYHDSVWQELEGPVLDSSQAGLELRWMGTGNHYLLFPSSAKFLCRIKEATMQLYVTPTSPFSWTVQIVVREKGLDDRLEIIRACTRTIRSSYYEVNPSGRVPYLVTDDGIGYEESALIMSYLDHLDGAPVFVHPGGKEGWESRRLEARTRSFLDGLCVWSRELYRPPEDRSETILAHERERAHRLADWWEGHLDNCCMNGALNVAQITLVCALHLNNVNIDFDWRAGRPFLSRWCDRIVARCSVGDTVPTSLLEV